EKMLVIWQRQSVHRNVIGIVLKIYPNPAASHEHHHNRRAQVKLKPSTRRCVAHGCVASWRLITFANINNSSVSKKPKIANNANEASGSLRQGGPQTKTSSPMANNAINVSTTAVDNVLASRRRMSHRHTRAETSIRISET